MYCNTEKISGIIGLLFLLAACAGGNLGVNPPPPDPVQAREKIDAAWKEYEKAQYYQAIELFNEARVLDSSVLDIYNGLGWSYFKIHNLITSLANFSTAISGDSSFPEAMVGYGVSAFEKAEYAPAIQVFTTLTKRDSLQFNLVGTDEFVFKHDASVTSRKVRKILALSYFYSGQFTEAYNQLKQYLDPVTKVDPASETFVKDLLNALKQI
jgi:tetratricopeptide (TPR) repeat protein